MTVLFDFDNTLFDTQAIKRMLLAVAREGGVSEREAAELYEQACRNKGTAVFSLERFCDLLHSGASAAQSVTPDQLRARIREEALLVPGARQLLTWLYQRHISPYLLSLGVPAWQKEKLAVSGLGKFFDPAHMLFTTGVREGKREAIFDTFGRDCTGTDMVLFNDKPDESAMLLEAFPDLIVYLRMDQTDRRYTSADAAALCARFPDRVASQPDLSAGPSFLAEHYSL